MRLFLVYVRPRLDPAPAATLAALAACGCGGRCPPECGRPSPHCQGTRSCAFVLVVVALPPSLNKTRLAIVGYPGVVMSSTRVQQPCCDVGWCDQPAPRRAAPARTAWQGPPGEWAFDRNTADGLQLASFLSASASTRATAHSPPVSPLNGIVSASGTVNRHGRSRSLKWSSVARQSHGVAAPNSAVVLRRIGPNLAKFDQILPRVDQQRPSVRRRLGIDLIWNGLDNIWADVGQIDHQKFPGFDQHLAEVSQIWPDFGQ